VFGVALALRVTCLFEWRSAAFFATPVGDGLVYLDWARRIAAGDWYGSEVFYQAPLYPYFLAVVLKVTGSELWAPRLVQALLGASACVLLGRASERFLGRAVGVTAALGLALYAPAIYFDGLLQKASLDSFLLSGLLFVLSATPIGVGRAVGAGALLGLLALSRENALVLAPVVAVWLAASPGVTSPASRAGAVGALALGLALVLVPVGLRNQSLGDRFLVTTSQLGPNLWIGNHPGATGRYEALRPGRGHARYEREDARALAVEAVGRELSPAEVSDYWRDRALSFMRDQPAEAARQMARKAFLVVNARELPDTESIEAYTAESLVLRVLFAVFHFGVLAPLALVGLVARASDWRRLWLFPGMALAIAASVAVFYVFARYRFTLVPVLMPLAAAGGVALWDAARGGARARKSLVTLALAGLAAALISNYPLGEREYAPGLTHLNVGNVLLEAGRLAEAQTELEKAVAGLPGYGFSHARLADVLRLRGEYERALASYDRALALLPTYPPALAGRGMALEALRRPGAEESYRRALSLDPNEPDSNNNLANILLKRGDARGAVPLYERALTARPNDARILSNLGTAHLETGDPRGALPLFERALAALPDDARMLSNLGTAHLHAGDPRGALPLFDRALTRDPRLASARINRAAALAALGRVDEAQLELHALLAQEPPESPYAAAARDALAQLGAR